MRLRILFEDSNLIDDPNWVLMAAYIGACRLPIDYNRTKDAFRDFNKENLPDSDPLKTLYNAIKDARMYANLELDDYPQLFKKPPMPGQFHDEDEFGNSGGFASAWVSMDEAVIQRSRVKTDIVIPQDIVVQLRKTLAEQQTILLQALDSILREKGRSIREFGEKNLGYYGM